MRIAFVGKGGSGKSTLAAAFALYLSQQTDRLVVVFDADLNIHAPELLGLGIIPFEKHLSNPEVTKVIQKWLIGDNDIPKLGAFRKTTPPTRKSNLFLLESLKESPIADFGVHQRNLSAFAVGTYQEEDIGASCYHNNLAILESLLNHTDDLYGYVIADMVAGVDSFAGTLHAQFDLTCLIVEPTKRSIEVYQKYMALAEEAGVAGTLRVVGNKIRSAADTDFIRQYVKPEHLLGYFSEDAHIRAVDQEGGPLDIERLSESNKEFLAILADELNALPDARNTRLKHLFNLHRTYVGQAFITERYGDLTTQIDPQFSYRQVET